MIKWVRIEAGDYESSDERFHIINGWDRINYIHWVLYDRNTNKEYVGNSLKHCKQIAVDIVFGEQRERMKD